jgi:hypothetical protein
MHAENKIMNTQTNLPASDDAPCYVSSLTPETDDFFCNPPENEAAFEFAQKLERQKDGAIAALESIEARYTDGCDTYEDWKFMGDTARDFLAANT